MRILTLGTLYPPHSIGGYELLWRDIMMQLRQRGHSVTVLCGDWRGIDNGEPEDPDAHRVLALHIDELFDVRRDGLRAVRDRERHNDAALRDLVDRARPDVAVLGPMGGLSFGLSRRLTELGIPQLALVYDDWPSYRLKADPWQARLRRLGPLGDRVAARAGLPGRFRPVDVEDWSVISERTRTVVVRQGVPVGRTVVQSPGPDADRFHAVAPLPWRRELLYSGRLHPDKGVEHLLEALPHLPGHRLTVMGAGDPRYADKLTAIVARHDLQDRVTFLGGSDFDAVPRLYAQADAVVFPSVWDEPWGLVPLEAMAVGRPVVACAVGGAAEYLRDGENALVVPTRDAQAIARAVLRLEDEELRERLRRGGAATASGYRYADFLAATSSRIEGLADG